MLHLVKSMLHLAFPLTDCNLCYIIVNLVTAFKEMILAPLLNI